jgi:hypothetical protein
MGGFHLTAVALCVLSIFIHMVYTLSIEKFYGFQMGPRTSEFIYPIHDAESEAGDANVPTRPLEQIVYYCTSNLICRYKAIATTSPVNCQNP